MKPATLGIATASRDVVGCNSRLIVWPGPMCVNVVQGLWLLHRSSPLLLLRHDCASAEFMPRSAGTVVGYAEQTHKCCSCSSWIKVYDAAGTLIYTLTSEWCWCRTLGRNHCGCQVRLLHCWPPLPVLSPWGQLHPVAAVWGQSGQLIWLCVELLC